MTKSPSTPSAGRTGTKGSTKSVQSEKATKSEAKETATNKALYKPEDWAVRNANGLPQRLLDENPQIKLDYKFPELLLNYVKMQRWTPTRMQASILTPEERQKYYESLDKIFSAEHVTGKRVLFDLNMLCDVLCKMRHCLKFETMLIDDVPNDTYVVGDLHGNIHDLARIFHDVTRRCAPGKKIYEHGRFVFLGDYVDRGYNGLEVIMALFMLKLLYPDRFILLRGNHEFFQINSTYSFHREMMQRYGKVNGSRLHNAINNTFGWLSVAAIIGGRIFCAHGGIATERFTKGELLAIRKPIHRSTDNLTVHDIVWSDPMIGLEGSMFNSGRGTSIYYGEDLLHSSLKKVGCLFMIRGHTLINKGYEYIWEGRCTNIFSATDSGDENNDASYAHIGDQNVMTIYIMKLDIRYRNCLKASANEPTEKEEVTKYEKVTGKIAVYGEK